MPTYAYLCTACGVKFETWQSIHDDALTEHTCGGALSRVYERLATLGVGTHGEHYAATETKERQWSKDMSAYKRLCTQEGLQPRQIDGCDHLEATAVSRWHVETGQPHPDHKVWEGMEMAKAIQRGDA